MAATIQADATPTAIASSRFFSAAWASSAPSSLFEDAAIPGYSTPAKDVVRQQVSAWIRHGGEFDAVFDFDKILHGPSHLARLLPAYDIGNHLHPNDADYRAAVSALLLGTLGNLTIGSAGVEPTAIADAHDKQRRQDRQAKGIGTFPTNRFRLASRLEHSRATWDDRANERPIRRRSTPA
ncbi:MAG TPA: hypothetical protein VGC19_14780 [Rhodanobacter sp.]